jgi:AcrR family transcriptional regulator
MSEPTEIRIVGAALELFTTQGLRKTSVDEVANRAGVSRVTVYRYFADREELVRAAFQRVAGLFAQLVAVPDHAGGHDLDGILERIGDVVALMPDGLPAAMGELRDLHPALHDEVTEQQETAVRRMLDLLFAIAEREGRIRSDVDRRVVDALFLEMLTRLVTHASLRSAGLTPSEIYRSVANLLVHGMLAPQP